MEIRDHRVDATERARGINEDVCLSRVVVVGGGGVTAEKIFDGANGRRADGDAASARREKDALGCWRQFVDFAVDDVFFDGRRGDRLKRAEADVEGDLGRADADSLEFGQEFGREVQASRGGGDGDLFGAVGVDGLVALDVVGAFGGRAFAFDIGRQRNLAEAVGNVGDGLVVGREKTDERAAVFVLGEDFPGEFGAVGKESANGKFFARLNEAVPNIGSTRQFGLK